eukprot:492575-Prorocentrum_minimum.AAC.1
MLLTLGVRAGRAAEEAAVKEAHRLQGVVATLEGEKRVWAALSGSHDAAHRKLVEAESARAASAASAEGLRAALRAAEAKLEEERAARKALEMERGVLQTQLAERSAGVASASEAHRAALGAAEAAAAEARARAAEAEEQLADVKGEQKENLARAGRALKEARRLQGAYRVILPNLLVFRPNNSPNRFPNARRLAKAVALP